MGLLVAALGGVLAGVLLKRARVEVSTRFIFNVVVLALVIAQTVLFFFDTALPTGVLLTLLMVLWGMDMVSSWGSSRYY
ncbi:MAG TPA: hypothetical protein GX735_07315 [Firmicutes bacterium]|jgi:hypothetical protein|nr:hypothetical protein [Bacillota bacterium]